MTPIRADGIPERADPGPRQRRARPCIDQFGRAEAIFSAPQIVMRSLRRPSQRPAEPDSTVHRPVQQAVAESAWSVRAATLASEAVEDEDPAKRLARYQSGYTKVVGSAPEFPPETDRDEGVDVDARLRWIENALLEKIRPSEADLNTLARERAQAVQNALLSSGEVAADRVFITTDRQAGASAEGAVRMEMKLE